MTYKEFKEKTIKVLEDLGIFSQGYEVLLKTDKISDEGHTNKYEDDNAGGGLPFKLIVFRLTVDEFGDSSISVVFNDTGRTASYDDNLNIQLSGSYVDNYFVKNKEYLYWNYNADTNIGISLEDPIIVSFPTGYSVLLKIEIYE